MSKIERIRKYMIEQNYRISAHAQEEADRGNLTKKGCGEHNFNR